MQKRIIFLIKNVVGFEIPFYKTIDIDSKEDYLLSKIIYKYFKI